MVRTIRNLFRLLMIARTLARHDALTPLETLGPMPVLLWVMHRLARRDASGRPGERLARALTELGPSFIKLGQTLSTRADLLGEQVARDLAELQDRLPPFPGAEARATIESELGQPVEALFRRFEDTPVSAASIAQVHFAETLDGEEVAVKVLRPGIERAFARDFALFKWLADIAESTQPTLRRFEPTQVVQLFAETVEIEMDLRMEASAAVELRENFEGDPDYQVAHVDWQRSSRRVLTMGRVRGIPIDDREALIAAGHDIEMILTRAAEIFFKQVFRDGFFHGDQHPGNLWVDENGAIVAVDFGIMGRLDYDTRTFLADMLMATLEGDYRRLAAIHAEAGWLPGTQALDVFAQALRSVCEPITGRPLNQISFARLLAQLLHVTESFDMPVQPQLLLLQKNMLMAEGVSRSLAPELNIWTLAQPLIEEWMRENRGPEARVRQAAQDIAEAFERLPRTLRRLDRIVGNLAEAGFKLDPESIDALKGSRNVWQLRLLWLALAIMGIAFAIS